MKIRPNFLFHTTEGTIDTWTMRKLRESYRFKPGGDPYRIVTTKRNYRKKSDDMRCDCKIFKLADSLYSAKPRAEKDVWNAAVKKPQRSGYNLWMTECVYAFMRGYMAPDQPSSSGGYSGIYTVPGFKHKPPPCAYRGPYDCWSGTVKWFLQEINPDYYGLFIEVNLITPPPVPIRQTAVHARLLWDEATHNFIAESEFTIPWQSFYQMTFLRKHTVDAAEKIAHVTFLHPSNLGVVIAEPDKLYNVPEQLPLKVPAWVR